MTDSTQGSTSHTLALGNPIERSITLQTPDGTCSITLQRLFSGAVQATIDGVRIGEASAGPILRVLLKLEKTQ